MFLSIPARESLRRGLDVWRIRFNSEKLANYGCNLVNTYTSYNVLFIKSFPSSLYFTWTCIDSRVYELVLREITIMYSYYAFVVVTVLHQYKYCLRRQIMKQTIGNKYFDPV